MKKGMSAALALIIIGTIAVALSDFGGRSKREAEDRAAYEREILELKKLAPSIVNPDVNRIEDYVNKNIEVKHLTYYERKEKNRETVERYFDYKPKSSEKTNDKITINYYDNENFHPIFSKRIVIDFIRNEIRTDEVTEHTILQAPVITGKSWLSKIEAAGEKLDFISEVRRTDLQRSIILNWRSFVLDSIIESYFESDIPVEGGHQLTRYNFRWSPQVNCFTEITMKKLIETENDTILEVHAFVLKEVVTE
ncbi:MAG: hypothetical protein PHW02_09445 [bacterium]|nr:hypothetical protein [bacterium]